MKRDILLCLFLFFFNCTSAYKATAIIHGVMFNATDHMQFLRDAIIASQPTTIDIMEMLYDEDSFLPMWYQVTRFRRSLISFMNSNPGGINLIAYSQGGLIARGVIATTPNHTVESFITLSSPIHGYHGAYLPPRSDFEVGNEERFANSVSGFWKDPRDMLSYKREGRYLATINNEIKHPLNRQFKDTMCRLKQFTLLGGPDDGIVVPWQSALYGYDDAYGNIIDMKRQSVYTNDCFCLRTLDNRGAITRYTVAGVRHPDWHNNQTVITNYVLPHLV